MGGDGVGINVKSGKGVGGGLVLKDSSFLAWLQKRRKKPDN
jgi:hypothetical protein